MTRIYEQFLVLKMAIFQLKIKLVQNSPWQAKQMNISRKITKLRKPIVNR